MSIVTGSTTISSSNINNINWPITINPSSGTTITFSSNVTFTKNTYYFIIGGNGTNQITITGSNLDNTLENLTTIGINISGTSYPGLVHNGAISAINPISAKNNVTIQYLAISSATTTIDSNVGWFTSSTYGLNLPQPNNLLIQYCTSAGPMNNSFSGGIVGASATAKVSNCISSCTLNNAGQGGIFGAYSTGIADICSSKCPAASKAAFVGGIFGSNSGGTAINCLYNPVNIQQLPADSGGIYGKSATNAKIINCRNTSNYNINGAGSGGIVGAFASNCIITGCTNNGQINGQSSGGIVGASASNCTINSCINNGAIIIQGGGGICGGYANGTTINNCTNANSSSDITGLGSGGIIGQNSKNCTIDNCTNLTNILGNGIGGSSGRIALSIVNKNFTASGSVKAKSIKSGTVISGLLP